MTYTHTCKCGVSYQSDDPDPYFCDACIVSRKAIAAELDARHPTVGQEPNGDFQSFMEKATFARGIPIVKASDLGL